MTKKENLIIFFDCYNLYFNDIKKYDQFSNNYKVTYCSFEEFKKDQKITIDIVNKKIDELLEKNNIKEKFIAIVHGQIGIWIYQHILKYNPKKIFLVGTPFAQSLLNPYLSDHPSYKIDEQSFERQIKKMSFKYRNNKNAISNKDFSGIYDDYSKNYSYYESFNAQLNDYIYLRHYCKTKIENNHYFIFGQNDELMNTKKQIKLLKKQNANYLMLENCSYFVLFDQSNLYIDYLKENLKITN